MATTQQLVQQIRFGLETLGERNAHHAFEQLCLGLARRRIVSNLLPATGPVSQGGDQARDSESHWTNLPAEIPGTSAFVGLAATEKVVVACTTQRDGLPAKIRADLTSIAAGGDAVRRVIYFSVAPLTVSKRHELQAYAREYYGINLDIWDAQAIANDLAEPDLFHLAVQYLDVPAELAPPPPDADGELPEWYIDLREKWRRGNGSIIAQFGEVMELRQALRYATFRREARTDLADWLGYARTMLSTMQSVDAEVVQRLRYEIAVATLRGTNALRPADELVRAFFGAAPHEDATHIGVMEDAVVLLQYCHGAVYHGVTSLSLSELGAWSAELRRRLDELLAAQPFPNAEARLRSVSARLAFRIKVPVGPAPDAAAGETPVSISERVFEAVEAADELPALDLDGILLVDADRGLADLERLCDLLPRARMFPVDSLADYFNLLSPLLTGYANYSKVRDCLDDAVGQVAGEAAKAERARDRAVRFFRSDRLLEALSEIHDAKVNWWHGDTLRGALLAMLLASEIYSRLRLPLAAKQYALQAAVIAQSNGGGTLADLVPRGIVSAVSCDYQAGSWLTATGALEAAAYAQRALATDPWNFERHEDLARALAHQAQVVQVARDLRPSYLAVINNVLVRSGLNAFVDPCVAELPSLSGAVLVRQIDEEGLGRPFSDAGPERRYTWQALGMSWTVEVENRRAAVLAAERFVAGAQIVLAELANSEPLLLRGRVHISVEVATGRSIDDTPGAASCEMVPDNEASRWVVRLIEYGRQNVEGFQGDLASALIYILITNSLLPQAAFMAVIDEAFRRGLWHKLAMGRPYDEVADIVRPELYDDMSALERGAVGADMPIRTDVAPELAPSHAPGPGYDHEQSLDAVARRYEVGLSIVRHTLPGLVTDLRFRAGISPLHAEGWLDWHLLLAVSNIVGNARVQWEGMAFPPGSQEEAEAAMQVMTRPERSDEPRLGAAAFSEDALRTALQTSMVSTVKGLGLECHQETPDFEAILELLKSRYGYWTDDVPHENFFLWPTG